MTFIIIVIIYSAIMIEYADWLEHVNYWKRWNREKGFIQFILEGNNNG